MNTGSLVQLSFESDPVVVLANKPVSVIQYGHDGDNMAGDPVMANTQGIAQFQDSYKFVTQNYHSVGSNTIAITILKNSTSELLLNGQSMSYWKAKNVSVSSPMDQYITLFVNVSHSSYYQLHHNGGKKFGAIIYGRPSTLAAYGYPLQLSFADTGCKTHEVSSITTPMHTHVPTVSTPTYSNISMSTYLNITTVSKPTYSNITTVSTPTYSNITTVSTPTYSNINTISMPTYLNITTVSKPTYSKITTVSKPKYSNITTVSTPTYSNISTSTYLNITTVFKPTYSNITTVSTPTYSNITNHGGKGKWCFHCEGMTHLQLCDRVQRCQTEDEVCYVQSYTRSLDVNLYRSGCINPQQCVSDDGNSGCVQCCDGSFCNSEGCGDKGFQPLGQRGPLCFDCTHIFDREECNTVQLCDYNQVCMIEKYKWGQGNFHNIMGCTHSQVCTRKRSVRGLNARHAPVCSHCCHTDFCNMNCTSVNTGIAITG